MQAGSPWTYLFCDLVTGTPILELPLTGVSFGETLNGVGQFAGSLPLKDPRVQRVGWRDATIPQRTLLIIFYDQSVVWSGIIWQRNYDSSSGLTLGGSTLWSIWSHREQQQKHGMTWNGAAGGDPCVIAKTMLEEAQALSVGAGAQIIGTAGNIPAGVPVTIIGGPTPAGFWTQQSYPLNQKQKIDAIVSNLSVLGYGAGFDFEMGVDPDGSGLDFTPYINLYYPRSGLVGSASGLVFDVSSAGEKFTYPEDGTRGQSHLTVASSQSGGVQGKSTTLVVVEEGFPLLEETISISGLHTNKAVQSVADAQLAVTAYPTVVPTCSIFADGDPALGSFKVGDDATFYVPAVAADTGLRYDDRFPDGLEELLRIISWSCSVPDAGGRAKVDLTFNLPPSLTVQRPAI